MIRDFQLSMRSNNPALGKGDVYSSGGTLVSHAASALEIRGDYTQLANATLELDVAEGGDAGRLNVRGDITLVGGTLHVKFAPGCHFSAGRLIEVIRHR